MTAGYWGRLRAIALDFGIWILGFGLKRSASLCHGASGGCRIPNSELKRDGGG